MRQSPCRPRGFGQPFQRLFRTRDQPVAIIRAAMLSVLVGLVWLMSCLAAEAQTVVSEPVRLGEAASGRAGPSYYTRPVALEAGDKVRVEFETAADGEVILMLMGSTPRGFFGTVERLVQTRLRQTGTFEAEVKTGGPYLLYVADGSLLGSRSFDFNYTISVTAGPTLLAANRGAGGSPSPTGPAGVAEPVGVSPRDATTGTGAPSYATWARISIPDNPMSFPLTVRRGDRITLALRACEGTFDLRVVQSGVFAARVRAQAAGRNPTITFAADNDAPYFVEYRETGGRPGANIKMGQWRADEVPSPQQAALLEPDCAPLSDALLKQAFGPLYDRIGRTYVDSSAYSNTQTFRWHRAGVIERLESVPGSAAAPTRTYYTIARPGGTLRVVNSAGWKAFDAQQVAGLFTELYSPEVWAEVQRRRQAERAQSRSEMLGFIGGAIGGVVAATGTNATDDQITAGIAVGSNLFGSGSSIARASADNLTAVHARMERERQQMLELIARQNDPNNPVNLELKAAEERRREASRERLEQTRAETQARLSAMEEADRAAYEARDAEQADVVSQSETDRAEADAQTRERRAAEEERRAAREREAEAKALREREAAERLQAEQRAAEERAAREREVAERAAAERQRQQEAEAERNRVLNWPEAITFCAPAPNSQTEYRCDGPLQPTYGTPGTPSFGLAVRQACGSDSVRNLGRTGGYEAWGCGFGILVNDQNRFGAFTDAAARLGIGYVPGRVIFRCPMGTNVCRMR